VTDVDPSATFGSSDSTPRSGCSMPSQAGSTQMYAQSELRPLKTRRPKFEMKSSSCSLSRVNMTDVRASIAASNRRNGNNATASYAADLEGSIAVCRDPSLGTAETSIPHIRRRSCIGPLDKAADVANIAPASCDECVSGPVAQAPRTAPAKTNVASERRKLTFSPCRFVKRTIHQPIEIPTRDCIHLGASSARCREAAAGDRQEMAGCSRGASSACPRSIVHD
jgi:hypothetical protein